MSNPIYSIDDKVVKSHRTFSFHGVVKQVIPAEAIPRALSALHRQDPAYAEQAINEWTERDPDFQSSALYFVRSDSKIATWEEAKAICPQLHREQYDLIVGPRQFLLLESDLLPAE